MTTPREAVDELLVVLASERQAIRNLDARTVEEAARTKQRLAEVLAASCPDDLVAVAREIPLLRAELRRNGVLLAHARRCINELIEIAAPRVGGRRGTLRARV